MKLKKICIFCGSTAGLDPIYISHAKQLASLLAAYNVQIIYGGGKAGLMGHFADKYLQLGGKITGIIPQFLAKKEVAHPDLTELHVVDSMHERKAMMQEFSDAFIALPGGLGTLEELFEVWTWAQLGLHPKPVALLNSNDYYNSLLVFLEHSSNQGFINRSSLDQLLIAPSPEDLMTQLQKL